MNVAVVGTGYVGTVTAVCLASLGSDVTGLDVDAARAAQLSAGQVPFYEPGLAELLTSVRATGRLRFTSDEADALDDADVVFVCVGTPEGDGGRPDLSALREAATAIARHLQGGEVVVTKSTVPVGSGNWMRTTIEDAAGRDVAFSIVSNPEFLREGSAIDDFLRPDRVVLGGDADGIERVLELFRPLLSGDGAPPVLTMDLPSAEMVKYASNVALATKISLANELSDLCGATGADPRAVLSAVGADARIGPAFLRPGLGWGGSCLPKDVAAMIAMGTEYSTPTPLLEAARAVNDARAERLVHVLQRELKAMQGRRIALLGLTFKPCTDDVRASPAVALAFRLLEGGSVVSAYDPVVKALDGAEDVRISADAYDAAERADAVVVATEWPEFAALDLPALAQRMRGDLILDARNALPSERARAAGLRLLEIGAPAV
jgi:nucleotide sugar dehydrogenase